jgi:hypothetical protein
MREVSIAGALAIFAGVTAWLIALWLAMHSACQAYYATPDLRDFGHFTYPLYTGHEGKDSDLFGPSIVALAAGLLLFSLNSRWLEKTERFQLYSLSLFRVRAIVAGILAFLFLIVTYDHANLALAAAARVHWHGSPLPNASIDDTCLFFR